RINQWDNESCVAVNHDAESHTVTCGCYNFSSKGRTWNGSGEDVVSLTYVTVGVDRQVYTLSPVVVATTTTTTTGSESNTSSVSYVVTGLWKQGWQGYSGSVSVVATIVVVVVWCLGCCFYHCNHANQYAIHDIPLISRHSHISSKEERERDVKKKKKKRNTEKIKINKKKRTVFIVFGAMGYLFKRKKAQFTKSYAQETYSGLRNGSDW
ncbi:hypothetical protein RFI_34582, partial [Reticulomyxa filosa]